MVDIFRSDPGPPKALDSDKSVRTCSWSTARVAQMRTCRFEGVAVLVVSPTDIEFAAVKPFVP